MRSDRTPAQPRSPITPTTRQESSEWSRKDNEAEELEVSILCTKREGSENPIRRRQQREKPRDNRSSSSDPPGSPPPSFPFTCWSWGLRASTRDRKNEASLPWVGGKRGRGW